MSLITSVRMKVSAYTSGFRHNGTYSLNPGVMPHLDFLRMWGIVRLDIGSVTKLIRSDISTFGQGHCQVLLIEAVVSEIVEF